jgi:steroid 5-alpha reductase family enzyme
MDQSRFRDNLWTGFGLIVVCYVLAAWIGTTVYNRLAGVLWVRLLVADALATLFVWMASCIFRNASIYDPYWSVQPMVILTLLLIQHSRYDAGTMILVAVILFWGFRLTLNWAFTFDGLGKQDWRYDLIKAQTGRLFPVANLLGIQLMPTLIVLLCILPAAYAIAQGGTFRYVSLVGVAVSASGAALQAVADRQLHAFRKQAADRSKIIRSGLWKHSRHPNYLGEILMWWGVCLAALPALPGRWHFIAGALLNTLLFLFISIPLAERHLAAYKEGYAEYRRSTRMLLPLPRLRAD